MHQVCRLDNQILYAVCDRSLQCLIHIVNAFSVSCLNMIDNDLRGKGSSYRPVRIRFLKCIFNSFNILYTAVIKRCSEADNKNLIFSDIILIQRIILGCIACISSKVIRICIFTFYQFLLGVCQCVPGFFRFLTLFIRLIRSLLYIDCVNQRCHLIRSLLILVFCTFFLVVFYCCFRIFIAFSGTS